MVGTPAEVAANVKNVVILVQENRSFDEYFGTLAGARGFNDPEALPSVFEQVWENSPLSPPPVVEPFHMSTATTSAEDTPGNNHDWVSQHLAWNNGQINGWLSKNAPYNPYFPSIGLNPGSLMSTSVQPPTCMGYFTSDDIPAQFALAQSFTVCDNYFCSVFGPTAPNRLYVMSGQIDPAGVAGGPVAGNPSGYPPNDNCSFSWVSYPEQLQEAGVSWAVYDEATATSDNYGGFDLNVLAYFINWSTSIGGRPMLKSVSTYKDQPGQFETDAGSGNLPQVSWIIGPFSKSEHPSFTPADGAAYVYEKLNTIMSSGYWGKTAFILVYDENDGAFDHVPPPVPPAGAPDEWLLATGPWNLPTGLPTWPIGPGFRVPAIIMSPWTVGGLVCSERFDHTSLLQFLGLVTGVAPQLSDYRRLFFGDLSAAFDFSNPVPASSVQLPSVQQVQQWATVADNTSGHPAPSAPLGHGPFKPPPESPGRPLRPTPLGCLESIAPGCMTAPAAVVRRWLNWAIDQARSNRGSG